MSLQKNTYSPEDIQLFQEPFYQIERKIQIMLDLGELLMENGANSKHIVRDLERCGIYLGIPKQYQNLYISYHTLMVNICGEDKSITSFRRATKHTMNMDRLAALSKLTWAALNDNYTITTFEQKLKHFKEMPTQYPYWLVQFGICIACGALTIIFGGGFMAAFITSISTFIGLLSIRLCEYFHINVYVTTALGAFVAMSISALSNMFFQSEETLVYAMVSCTLFMVPGIPMINAIDDLFNNYILSGMTRFSHTFLTVCSMTFGIAMALHFMPVPDFDSISIIPSTIYPMQLLAACISAVGFALLFNAPIKFLPLIGIGGTACLAIRNFLIVDYSFYAPGAALIAAACIGIAMNKLASYFDTSQLVLASPSVVTLLPGILFYRFLFAIIQINHLTPEGLIISMQNGVTAMIIIMSLSVGVTISNIFGQHYMDMKKKEKLEALLLERKEIFEEKST